MTLLQVVSLGQNVDIWRPQTGVVHSAFDHAINLLMNGELWTVLASDQQDTPFGIRIAPGHRRGGRLAQAADRVHVRAGYVGVGHLTLDCRTAMCWAPAAWTRPATSIEGRLSAVEQMARPRSWSESAALATSVTDALPESDAALARAVRCTLGRGPGLTPAGDDVLVGILAVLTSAAAGPAGKQATARLVRALTPALPSTSDVSRHLLDQASRGLSGRALNGLGKALVEGAPDRELADAVELVLGIGATSGADACMGLIAACRSSFRINMESFTA